MIVADTNLIAYFLLPSDESAGAEAVFRKDQEWASPYLWRSELRNVLTQYIKRNVLSLRQALDVMADAETLLHGRVLRFFRTDNSACGRIGLLRLRLRIRCVSRAAWCLPCNFGLADSRRIC